MQVRTTTLPGVLLIEPPTVFEDFRGTYVETYNEQLYRDKGIDIRFVQDDISVSDRHVLRGLHGDAETWKLVSCLYGKFYLVVIDADEDSKGYGRWEAFTLSESNRLQVLIPPQHGNGHLVMSETAMFHYKQSTYYNPRGQFTIRWNDPRFKIWWPVKEPIVSQRDESGRFVAKAQP